MRAAVYYGNHKIQIEDVEEPTVRAGHVKVKVSGNGICGTDLHEYFDGPVFIPPETPHPLTGQSMPVVLGTSSPASSSRWAPASPMSTRARSRSSHP